MFITLLQLILSTISGMAVGFTLGLIGGGGSIMAIPLLLYFVGIDNVHLAIGTTALAVGVNAYINALSHRRHAKVRVNVGILFSVVGVAGVYLGSSLGLVTNSDSLLILFSVLMIGIGIFMYVGRRDASKSVNGEKQVERVRKYRYPVLVLSAVLTGFASGFFGIGGGFLIVPALVYSAGMEIDEAVGTSLLVVGTFGIVTAIRYGISGSLLYPVAFFYIIGGIIGGIVGSRVSLGLPKHLLRKVFSVVVILVGIYIMLRTLA